MTEAWTVASVRETGAEFRRLCYAWTWPESVLDLYDSENARRGLRELRTTAQSTVDRMTRQADRSAAAGDMAAASHWLESAADFWEGFERRAGTLRGLADETAVERTARYVDETAADVADAAHAYGEIVQNVAGSAGLGVALAAVVALMVLKGR